MFQRTGKAIFKRARLFHYSLEENPIFFFGFGLLLGFFLSKHNCAALMETNIHRFH